MLSISVVFEKSTRLPQPLVFCLSIKRRLLFLLRHSNITSYKFRSLCSSLSSLSPFSATIQRVILCADYSLYVLYVLRGSLTLTLLSHMSCFDDSSEWGPRTMLNLVRGTSVTMLSSLNIIVQAQVSTDTKALFSLFFKIGFYDLNNVWPVMC